jgi:hypothetical protein
MTLRKWEDTENWKRKHCHPLLRTCFLRGYGPFIIQTMGWMNEVNDMSVTGLMLGRSVCILFDKWVCLSMINANSSTAGPKLCSWPLLSDFRM